MKKTYRDVNCYKVMTRILLSIIVILVSCSTETREEKEIKELFGREICFPNSYEIVSDAECDVEVALRSTVKVVSYIDDFSCSSCTMSMLNQWSQEIKDSLPNIDYIFVLRIQNGGEVKAIQELHIPFPIIVYSNDDFGEANGLDYVLARNKTLLVFKGNIVLVGEPYGSERKWNLYRRA